MSKVTRIATSTEHTVLGGTVKLPKPLKIVPLGEKMPAIMAPMERTAVTHKSTNTNTHLIRVPLRNARILSKCDHWISPRLAPLTMTVPL